MSVPHSRLRFPSWLRVPPRTARFRLTALFGGLFLLSGAALVAVTYLLFERATAFSAPALPKVPRVPSIQDLQLLPIRKAFAQLSKDQGQLAHLQVQLGQAVGPDPSLPRSGTRPTVVFRTLTPMQLENLTHLQRDQHRLAQATNHVTQAVHQLAQASSVQAAQRAADSHQLLVNSGIALAVVAVLAIVAGWLVAGRMLRPIRTITRTARRISSTSLHERLALDGPQDELRQLGDTLDGLFARLEAAFDAQRHFVANASHELRTPLTAERNLLQVALDDPGTTSAEWRSTAEEVLASNAEQARLVDGLLTLASSEGGLSEREPVDLAAIVLDSVLVLEPEIHRLDIHVDGDTQPAPLDGDSLLVERLVVNLLTNAMRHNVVGGEMTVLTGAMDGKAFVAVSNTGPQVPPHEVERLFQPFQRLDPRRVIRKDGHGLGLSIVRAIAAAHGATITAEPMPEGGLSVSVVFPANTTSEDVHGESPRSRGDITELELVAT